MPHADPSTDLAALVREIALTGARSMAPACPPRPSPTVRLALLQGELDALVSRVHQLHLELRVSAATDVRSHLDELLLCLGDAIGEADAARRAMRVTS